MADAAAPPPLLVALFESVAAAMGIDQGHEELRLEFENGRLRRWSTHDVRNGAPDLHQFDELARYELERLVASR